MQDREDAQGTAAGVVSTSSKLIRKVALLIGAGRRIGRAIALALAVNGAHVAVNFRSRQAGADEVRSQIDALRQCSITVGADVSLGAEVSSMMDVVQRQLGPTCVLVNNAGIARPELVEHITEQNWDELLVCNLRSQFLVIQAALPSMRMGGTMFCFYGFVTELALFLSCLLTIACILLVPRVSSSQLSIISDEQPRYTTQLSVTAGNHNTIFNQPQIDIANSAYNIGQDSQSSELLEQKSELRELIGFRLEEEDRWMRQVVQGLDRDSARRWLSKFISTNPWNCPFKMQREWIEAIIYAAEKNQLPLCKELLGLVASIISIESGFHADPLAIDPSRNRSMEDMIRRAEEKLYQKHETLMSLSPVARLYNEYKDRYYSKLVACQTEWEIELVARNIAADLKKDAEKLPAAVGNVINKEIDKVNNVIRSKGSMQLKFAKARQVMKERGDEFSDDELIEYMYTINGGVDAGVAALKPVFVQYAAWCARDAELSWLFFVGMDYNYGFFSSRNMMEQIRIRDLTGHDITIDGDLLRYGKNGKPDIGNSETFLAAQVALPAISKDTIFKAFLLEKDQDYIYTDVHRHILDITREKFGTTPFAIIGRRSLGENAEVKYGTTWTTDAYFRKLDRHLNSIPWDD